MDRSYPSLRGLLLEMADERSLEELLSRITAGLAAEADVALARIWLLEPGDRCEVCSMRDRCPQHVPCLQLVASAGTPLDGKLDWGRIDGRFSRFPIGVRKIGHIGSGEALRIERIEDDSDWIADPAWAAREGIVGFGGAPLAHHGEVFGVLGVFTRSEFCSDTFEWLQIMADHAAAALANARAFAEIERLRAELTIENEYLRQEVSEAKSFGEIIGESAALRRVLERIDLVAPTHATVLVQGESGTGKELVAREIHARSPRAARPLIQVNCAAIPSELYESEFFGHAKGSFTGATRDRAGRFAAAHGGSLFLDEVGEIPLSLQAKLLRVLQEGRYERVGEEQSREVDVRVIAATNRDLFAEVRAGRFREDLYYRLDVFPIEIVPLRERGKDVVLLARHFVRTAAERLGQKPPRLAEGAAAALEAYAWPGNVRELQNVIERAMIMWRGGPLEIALTPGGASSPDRSGATGERPEPETILREAELRELERNNLIAALRHTRWRIAGRDGAAELLGVPPTTLRSRISKLGIERPI